MLEYGCIVFRRELEDVGAAFKAHDTEIQGLWHLYQMPAEFYE